MFLLFSHVNLDGIVKLLFLPGRFRNLSKLDRVLMCWWAFTGLTHMILEGYFVFSPEFYKEKTGFYLAEVCKFLFSVLPFPVYDHLPCLVWFLSGKILLCKLMAGKEYSKGDSRYAGRDSAIVAVEGITSVLEGPPCLLAV